MPRIRTKDQSITYQAEPVRFELTRAVLGTHARFQDVLLPVASTPFVYHHTDTTHLLYVRTVTVASRHTVLHTGFEPAIFTLRG